MLWAKGMEPSAGPNSRIFAHHQTSHSDHARWKTSSSTWQKEFNTLALRQFYILCELPPWSSFPFRFLRRVQFFSWSSHLLAVRVGEASNPGPPNQSDPDATTKLRRHSEALLQFHDLSHVWPNFLFHSKWTLQCFGDTTHWQTCRAGE